jgi:hypothetical protein
MKRILRFSEFGINEAVIDRSSDWPENWKDLPEWPQLQELGFEDATTTQMERNGNILLMNHSIPVYPGGIVLQRSGYIRNKTAESGFITKMPREFTLKQMLAYLVKRFSKISNKKSLGSEKYGPLSEGMLLFLDQVVTGLNGRGGRANCTWNEETQRIDVMGNVGLDKIKRIPEEAKFGNVTGYFTCKSCGLDNLELAPRRVGTLFYCSSNNLKTLRGGPEYVGDTYDFTNNKVESLEGIAYGMKGYLMCNNNNLVDLKGCPETVNGIFLNGNKGLKSLDGIPPFLFELRTDFFQIRDNKALITSIFAKIMDIVLNGGFKQNSTYNVENNDSWITFYDHTKYSNPHQRLMGYIPNPGEDQIEKIIKLISSTSDENYLDAYFKERPMKLYLLDKYPELKKGVLARTGMKDLSQVGKSLDMGLI